MQRRDVLINFQDLKNIINVIFGGDGGFPSKCA
jgi:hypothetical protein